MNHICKILHFSLFALIMGDFSYSRCVSPTAGKDNPSQAFDLSRESKDTIDLNKILEELNRPTSPENPAKPQDNLSACTIALALYKLVGKNCLQAAYKLHSLLKAQPARHPYLTKTLQDLFTQAKDAKNMSYDHIPQALSHNSQFCSLLKQSITDPRQRIEEKPDPAVPAFKELHRNLHYFSWLEALNNTEKSYCTRPFYTESYKGLSENLKLIVWSMIQDNYH